MNITRNVALLTPCTLIFTACSFTPPPVPVQGRQADVSTLEGSWSGEYASSESGRAGSIEFQLVAGTDVASGHILMIPANALPHEHEGDVHPPNEFIDIDFVRVFGGELEGRLAPYRDPMCGCRLQTTFTGTLTEDVITGTFRSLHLDSGEVQEGEWRVSRVG